MQRQCAAHCEHIGERTVNSWMKHGQIRMYLQKPRVRTNVPEKSVPHPQLVLMEPIRKRLAIEIENDNSEIGA